MYLFILIYRIYPGGFAKIGDQLCGLQGTVSWGDLVQWKEQMEWETAQREGNWEDIRQEDNPASVSLAFWRPHSTVMRGQNPGKMHSSLLLCSSTAGRCTHPKAKHEGGSPLLLIQAGLGLSDSSLARCKRLIKRYQSGVWFPQGGRLHRLCKQGLQLQ